VSTADSPSIETAANLLAAAHKSGRPIPVEAFPVPATYAEVVAIQAHTMVLLGERLGGWKISLTSTGAAVPAPMFASSMYQGTARHILVPGRAIGFEAEIAVRLGADLPARPGKPYSRAEIENAVGAALVGIEIVDSRFGHTIKPPANAALADRINNAGYVAGPDVANWRALDLARLRCVVTRDGKVVHDKVGGHPQNDPLLPLERYASAQIDPMGGLKRGQIVTLGSLIGLHWFDVPCRLVVTIEGLGEVSFDIAAA
jgi:2-keto-4-pentenoate hydratase